MQPVTTDRITSQPDDALGARLLRFTTAAIGEHRGPEQLLSHSLAETSTHDAAHVTSADSHRTFLWTMTVRACRRLLDEAEATHWWTAARDAEHAWADPSVSADPHAVEVAAADPRRLAAALLALPDVDRIAVLLHDVEAMPVPLVAAAMRSPEGVAAQRLRRGRMTLVVALAGPSSAATATVTVTGSPGRADVDEGERPGPAFDSDCGRARLWAAGAGYGSGARVDDAHVTTCAGCAALVAALDTVRARLAEQPAPPPSAGIDEQLGLC